MRKLILLPDILEYRELTPITIDEFLELYDFNGDPDNAFASFKEQNDFYDLEDIATDFEDADYELVISSGDPVFSFDSSRSNVVSKGVVRLSETPNFKQQTFKFLKPKRFCIIFADSTNFKVYSSYDSTEPVVCSASGKSMDKHHKVLESYALKFYVRVHDINYTATSNIIKTINEAFEGLRLKPSNNILSIDCYVDFEDEQTVPVTLQKCLAKYDLTTFRVQGSSFISNPIRCDLGLTDRTPGDDAVAKEDNLYLAALLLNTCYVCITNFHNLNEVKLQNITSSFNESDYKIYIEDKYLSFTNESLKERIVIELSLNELIRHYEMYNQLLMEN